MKDKAKLKDAETQTINLHDIAKESGEHSHEISGY